MTMLGRYRGRWLAGIGAAAVAAALAGCGSSTPASGGGGSSKSSGSGGGKGTTTVTMAIPVTAAEFSLPEIAVDHHLFPSNLNVKWTILPGSELIAPVSSGQFPLAEVANPTLDLAAVTSHKPVSWLAQWGDPSDFEVLARPGISSLSALKGKPVGVTTPEASTSILTRVALGKGGLSPSDYTAVSLGSISGQVTAFSAGRVDAVLLPSTTGDQILKSVKGSHVVYDFYKEKFPWVDAGLMGYMPWVKSHPQIVSEVLQGLNKALALAHSDPDAVKSSVAKFVGATSAAQIASYTQELQTKTPKKLEPMSLSTETNVLSVLRQNGFPSASNSLASGLVNNSYLSKAQ